MINVIIFGEKFSKIMQLKNIIKQEAQKGLRSSTGSRSNMNATGIIVLEKIIFNTIRYIRKSKIYAEQMIL